MVVPATAPARRLQQESTSGFIRLAHERLE
jgi:hypothetical protein